MSKQTFSRWTVIGEAPLVQSKERRWLCRCECGTERYVLERSLLNGASKSCGCLRSEILFEKLSRDLAGQVFGDLTVLDQAEYQRKNGGVWWTCRCNCGNLYDVPGTFLVTGKRTHCAARVHERYYAYKDIAGKRFYRLLAQYPTDKRGTGKSVVWHCQCDCGNEIDVTYNNLVYGNMRSCGCRKKENNHNLQKNLVHVDGTSIDHIKSNRVSACNTSGYRGVYWIRGKYVAKIVFQQKAYYLGSYDQIEEALEARRRAEKELFDKTVAYYEAYRQRAECSPEWAADNPINIQVSYVDHTFTVLCTPVLN